MRFFSFLLFITIPASFLSSEAGFSFNKEAVNKESLKLAGKLAKNNCYIIETTQDGGSKQPELFKGLIKCCSQAELKEYTNYPNGVVRAYAFEGLAESKSTELVKIAGIHLNDTDRVCTDENDPKRTMLVIDLMLNTVRKHAKKGNITLSDEERSQLLGYEEVVAKRWLQRFSAD